MGGVIIPKTFVVADRSLIFLAGPIRGAPEWQEEAIDFIMSKKPETYVASPRREVRGNVSRYVLSGMDNHFLRQREWERYYLDVASQNGSIMFWLPGEENHSCSKSYGAMTRLELGQWMTNYRKDNSLRVVFGSDGKFSEIDTIKYDLSLDAPNKVIYPTLEETCSAALDLAYSP